MPTQLSVNLNAVALLRNRRDLPWPSVTGIGKLALEAGAHGLTVHPRPDERHIRRADVPELAALIRREFPGRELNIEGNPDARFIELCEAIKPDQATLVPDDIRQATSDHGWDIAAHKTFLQDIIARLKGSGIRVSVFIDAEPPGSNIAALAAAVGANRVEIYTGPYGGTFDPAAKQGELDKVVATGNAAKAAGLGLNAGHDLTRDNLPALRSALPHLAEVSIGHALIADALTFGIGETVRLFRAAIGNPTD